MAIDAEHRTVVSLLVHRSAIVGGLAGYIALHFATASGNEDLFYDLQKPAAQILYMADQVSALLHVAACGGSTKIIKALLSKGARLEDKDAYGRTALHLCDCTGK